MTMNEVCEKWQKISGSHPIMHQAKVNRTKKLAIIGEKLKISWGFFHIIFLLLLAKVTKQLNFFKIFNRMHVFFSLNTFLPITPVVMYVNILTSCKESLNMKQIWNVNPHKKRRGETLAEWSLAKKKQPTSIIQIKTKPKTVMSNW